MAPVSRRTVYGLFAQRLVAVTNAHGYYGQIGRPLVHNLPTPPDPIVKDPTTGDLRVQPYFVLYPGAGTDGPDEPLCDTDDALTLDPRITAAAGDVEDLLALIDRLDGLLTGWTPTAAGLACGRVGRLPGSSAPVLTDNTVKPPRQFAQLQYALVATH